MGEAPWGALPVLGRASECYVRDRPLGYSLVAPRTSTSPQPELSSRACREMNGGDEWRRSTQVINGGDQCRRVSP